MWPSAEAQSSARNRKSKRVRVKSIACTQCAQIGETENVPQQDTVNGTQSTSHRPRFANQAPSNAATIHAETTVRKGLISHLHCMNRRRTHGTQRRGGVRRFTCLVQLFSGGDS